MEARVVVEGVGCGYGAGAVAGVAGEVVGAHSGRGGRRAWQR